jgi:CRP/FNR family transcriptional regulator
MKALRSRFPHLERKLLQRACQELDAAQDAALALARLQPAEKLADFLLRLAAREAKLGATACACRCRWAAAISPTIWA